MPDTHDEATTNLSDAMERVIDALDRAGVLLHDDQAERVRMLAERAEHAESQLDRTRARLTSLRDRDA